MKKIFTLKPEISTAMNLLYGKGATSMIESLANEYDVSKGKFTFSPFRLSNSNYISFCFNDFDVDVEYNPDGWNVWPLTIPKCSLTKTYFVYQSIGGIPSIAYWDKDEGAWFIEGKTLIAKLNIESFVYRRVDIPEEALDALDDFDQNLYGEDDGKTSS